MDDKLNTFLSALWRGGAHGNYWRSSDKLVQWTTVMPIADCTLGTSNVYMSVHPTRLERAKYERTRIEDVSCINCLFAEWDAKDFGGEMANVREHIKALAIQPQVIVESGGGYHGYWFIDEPMPVTPDGVVYLSGIQAAWVKMNGGDPGAKDMARVLRLPGTFNAKYAPYRKVGFSRFNLVMAPRYSLADLCALAEPYWAEESTTQTTANIPTTEHGQKAGAIAAIVDKFRTAQQGERNKMLLWAACKMYEHGMSVVSVQAELLNVALSIGLTEHETLATIRSAAKQPARPQEPTAQNTRYQPRSRSLDTAIENMTRKHQ